MSFFRRHIPQSPGPDLRELLDTGMRCYAATGGGEYFDGYTDALARVLAAHEGTDRMHEVLASAARVGIDPASKELKARR